MQVCRKVFSKQLGYLKKWSTLAKSYCSSELVIQEVVEKRNYLFKQEQQKQIESVGRIDKITVDVVGRPEEITLVMNNEISTPFDCAKHISEGLCQQAALALVNDQVLWDMHRPLVGNCKLQFLTFKDRNPHDLNKVFWRTGSFLLGAVACRAFKDNVKVQLHSFPPPFLRSGSFIYDIYLGINMWNPTIEELRILSAEFLTFVQQNHKIERLRVKKKVALEIFEDNEFKCQQLASIVENDKEKMVTLYRVDDHVDISVGPMVGDTSFFGRCTVTNVIPIPDRILLHRFQGVALPKGILLNSYAYSIIEKRGAIMNEAQLPLTPKDFPKNNSIDRLSLTDVPKSPLSFDV